MAAQDELAELLGWNRNNNDKIDLRRLPLVLNVLILMSLIDCSQFPTETEIDETIYPTENALTLSTTTPEAQTVDESEIIIANSKEDISQRSLELTGKPEIRFVHDADGSLRIQTSNFQGTCKIVYLLEGEELTDELKASRGWGEQDCQVNRDLETAVKLNPAEFADEHFPEVDDEVVEIYFVIRASNQTWETADAVDITDEVRAA